jgi:general secretion pathway protein K
VSTPLHHPLQRRQRGTALLLAMLTVALVATLSSAAYWHQWQAWSVEQAQRQQAQTSWLLTGALDWARLILREDARASAVDHLAEPWALPLEETRISTFLAPDSTSSEGPQLEAFLAGQVEDLQGKLNFRNLVDADPSQPKASAADVDVFAKLFTSLNLPLQELQSATQGLIRALTPVTPENPQVQPLLPERFEQLVWLGLSRTSLERLAPYATWLPERTVLNLNTCEALTLYASVPGLELSQATAAIQQRRQQHFATVTDALAALGASGSGAKPERFSTTSRYFLVSGQLRLDDLTVRERSLVSRNGILIQTVWRERGTLAVGNTGQSR